MQKCWRGGRAAVIGGIKGDPVNKRAGLANCFPERPCGRNLPRSLCRGSGRPGQLPPGPGRPSVACLQRLPRWSPHSSRRKSRRTFVRIDGVLGRREGFSCLGSSSVHTLISSFKANGTKLLIFGLHRPPPKYIMSHGYVSFFILKTRLGRPLFKFCLFNNLRLD
jgi:hypothetical protein